MRSEKLVLTALNFLVGNQYACYNYGNSELVKNFSPLLNFGVIFNFLSTTVAKGKTTKRRKQVFSEVLVCSI